MKQDVNNDGVVTPLDLLLIINYLNTNGSGELWPRSSASPYLDITGDDVVTPMDVLLGINWLNENSRGEGEIFQDAAPDPLDVPERVPLATLITGTGGSLRIRFTDEQEDLQNSTQGSRSACLPPDPRATLSLPWCASGPIAADSHAIDLLLGEDLISDEFWPWRDSLEVPDEALD